MYSLGELRAGFTVKIDGVPFLITACQHKKQARGAGVVKTTLKNLKTGATIPKTFQGNDKLEPAEVGFFKAQFLYKNGEDFEFMNNETFETFAITKDILGDDALFLKEGENFDLRHFEEEPIGINLQVSMAFKIQETVPGVKGDTVSGGSKPATLENGLVIQVPLYINEEDTVQINTTTKEFQKRING